MRRTYVKPTLHQHRRRCQFLKNLKLSEFKILKLRNDNQHKNDARPATLHPKQRNIRVPACSQQRQNAHCYGRTHTMLQYLHVMSVFFFRSSCPSKNSAQHTHIRVCRFFILATYEYREVRTYVLQVLCSVVTKLRHRELLAEILHRNAVVKGART